jgi:16S rRNA (cytosine967-C5)-methyltransferase
VIAPARTAAYHALRAVLGEKRDLPAALVETRRALEDERDRALAAEIVVGTMRWLRSLDFLIEHFAKRPVRKIDAEVAAILRLSVYQLLHLDRVPASAVVDDAVNLVRAARKPSATGFVNAVLRSLLRQRHKLPLPTRPFDFAQGKPSDLRARQVEYLGVTHSHPDWLVDRWLDRHGFEAAEAWVRFDNDTPPLTVRVNTLRATVDEAMRVLEADGVETERARYAPDALVVTAGNPLRRDPDGLVFVQDEASQLVSLLVDAQPGERVLDLCASPGGKTTAMAAAMGDRGTIVATDVRPRRVELLRKTVAASGAQSIQVQQVDARGALPFSADFDRVLVDAPCSGLGTIRRDPDIRWRRSEADLGTLAEDQLALLERAALVVRSGGRLIYATCSSEPEENEQVVEKFLAAHANFEATSLAGAPLPGAAHPLVDANGMFRTLPFRDGLEAFFAAALRRR